MQPARKAQNSTRGIRASDRGRGRGRGNVLQAAKASANSASISASHSPGTGQRGATGRPFRGLRGHGATRARGNVSQRFNSPPTKIGQTHLPVLTIHPSPEDIKPYEHDQLEARRTKLSEQYEKYRQNAISQGLMSDDKQSSLDDAIKTIGTCTQMCDEKERVNRIYESQTDAAERLPHPGTGRSVPIEGRMVKKFRRSAAGVDKQIPEELRTPHTLQKTLDYLSDEIIGKNRLGKHHKFVWDRTRAIRNDFSIQSLTSPDHVRAEVDCYERIVRFHILSAHQLSNPDSLEEDEHFEHQQELEQLQKTFQSLMDKYDTFRNNVNFPNEPEMRAYYILFSPILFSFDTEVQIQQWPLHILNDGRVQTALSLYAAMGNTARSVGSKNLDPIPVAIAQANVGHFWSLLDSQRVGYLMACVAEMSFQNVRFTSLDSLWQSAKNASPKMLERMTSWTKDALTDYLWYDNVEQTEALCEKANVAFSIRSDGQEYLDFRSNPASKLDNPFSKPEQVFSEGLVEAKRHGRTLVAIMSGMSIAQAGRAGMIEEDYEAPPTDTKSAIRSNMFFGEDETEQDDEQVGQAVQHTSNFGLNPQATTFTPTTFGVPSATSAQPTWMHSFGQERSSDLASPGGPPKGLFGAKISSDEQGEPRQPVAVASNPFPAQTLGKDTRSFVKQTTAFDRVASPNITFFPNSRSTSAADDTSLPITRNHSQEAIGQPEGSKPVVNLAPAEEKHASLPAQFSWALAKTQPIDVSNEQVAAPNFNPPSANTSIQGTIFNPDQVGTTQHSQHPPTQPTPTFSFDFSSKAGSSSLPNTERSDSKSTVQPSPPKFAFNQSPAPEPTSLTAPLPVKRPSLTDFTFPSVSTSTIAAKSHTPPGSPKQSLSSQPSSSLPKSVTSGPERQLASIPTVVSPNSEPTEDRVSEEELLTHLCRIGLVQQNGILDMFISYRVSQIVKDVYQAFHGQMFRQRTIAVKQKYLQRKYFAQWRLVVEQRRLQKRAHRRREKLAASALAASEKRRKEEAEMKEIIEAQNLKKQIQEEQEQQKQKASRTTISKDMPPPTMPQSSMSQQMAGQKRKVLANSTSSQNLQGVAMSPIHKRSRTLGNSKDSTRASVPNESLRTSVGVSSLRRSLSYRSLRQSVTEQGLDQTKSDYFRLKAHGVDPDTPFVPETGKDLEARKQKEAEYQLSVNARVLRRSISSIQRQTTESSAPESITTPPTSNTINQAIAAIQQRSDDEAKSGKVEDPFLRQLREAREAMVADEDWFRVQTAELEKEVELQGSHHSQGSVASQEDSVFRSSNGFTRSQSGRDYIPLDLKPGQTLSRTELRIQQTGARGFANRPVGGSPASTPRSSHSAVAMSRKTASQLQSGHPVNLPQVMAGRMEQSNQPGKRSIEDVYYANGHGGSDEEAGLGIEVQRRQYAHKKQRNGVTAQALHELANANACKPSHLAGGSHRLGHYTGYEDDEEEDDEQESDNNEITGDEVEGNLLHPSDARNPLNYPTHHGGKQQYYLEDETDDAEDEGDENEDGLVDEDEDEEDGDAEEDLEYPEHYYDEEEEDEAQPRRGYYVDENGDYLPPPRLAGDLDQGSRVMHSATPDTGVGSTAAEAIELSD